MRDDLGGKLDKLDRAALEALLADPTKLLQSGNGG